MKVLYVLCVIVLVSVVLGGSHHGAPHKANTDFCKYSNHQGQAFNLHLLSNHYSDLQFYDANGSKGTVYFNPCGAVTYSQCDANSSVCLIENGKGISFGSVNNVQRADVQIPAAKGRQGSAEFMYGSGELCNNGVNRKAVVTYICDMNMADNSYSYPKITATVEDCLISLTVETPFACPVANYCASITGDQKCNEQSGICVWRYGKCRANSGCFGGLTETTAGILSFIVVTTTGLIMLCLCGLCICACRKAGKKCSAKKLPTKKCRGKKRSAQKPKPEATFDSFEMPYQLIPGGSAPINPYSNIQGYYVMPSQDENAGL